MQLKYLIPILAVALAAQVASAHDAPKAGAKAADAVNKEQYAWGVAGNAKAAKRSIRIRMIDSMRFMPDRIEVRQGETLRLVLVNEGKLMHEMVIGPMEELKEHAEMMKKHPTMEHDEPYMAHVAPGKSETIIWQFTKAGDFHFGCLVPGHFEAGMVGKIRVLAKGENK